MTEKNVIDKLRTLANGQLCTVTFHNKHNGRYVMKNLRFVDAKRQVFEPDSSGKCKCGKTICRFVDDEDIALDIELKDVYDVSTDGYPDANEPKPLDLVIRSGEPTWNRERLLSALSGIYHFRLLVGEGKFYDCLLSLEDSAPHQLVFISMGDGYTKPCKMAIAASEYMDGSVQLFARNGDTVMGIVDKSELCIDESKLKYGEAYNVCGVETNNEPKACLLMAVFKNHLIFGTLTEPNIPAIKHITVTVKDLDEGKYKIYPLVVGKDG